MIADAYIKNAEAPGVLMTIITGYPVSVNKIIFSNSHRLEWLPAHFLTIHPCAYICLT